MTAACPQMQTLLSVVLTDLDELIAVEDDVAGIGSANVAMVDPTGGR